MTEYIFSSGNTMYGTCGSEFHIIIAEGGYASTTTVNSGGLLDVTSGGSAYVTTVNNGGLFNVSSGGTATYGNVYSGGVVNIYSGALLDGFGVNQSGTLNIFSGATLNNIVVYNGGTLSLSSGVVATNLTGSFSSKLLFSADVAAGEIVANGGLLTIRNGGSMNVVTVSSGGRVEVSSGGLADKVSVFNYASLSVLSGGSVNTANLSGGTLNIVPGGTVNSTNLSLGTLIISSGGSMSNISVNNRGRINVAADATAENVRVNTGGNVFVASDGAVNGITLNSRGSMYVYSGGTANEIIENGGYVNLEDGATATFTPNSFSGLTISSAIATVHSGTTASDIAISSKGTIIVSSGGSAVNLIEDGGYVQIEEGAIVTFQSNTISDTLIADWNSATIHSGTMAISTTIYGGDPGGMMDVFSGGIAEETVISGGTMNIYGGATVGKTIMSGGTMTIYSGATVSNTTFDGGFLNVMGATVIGVTQSFGAINISDGGFVGDIVFNGGYYARFTGEETFTSWWMPSVNVSSGCTAADLKGWDGKIMISSGGVVSGVEIGATYYGINHTSGSGYYKTYEDEESEIRSVWVANPGIHLSAGGKLTGQMTFSSGAKVYAESGSILDFDLTATSAGATALVSDLSVVEGAPTYTLTVAGTPQTSLYRLADGLGPANTFDGGVTALTVSGDQIGVLSVGQTFVSGGTEYLLSVADGSLTLSITQIVAPDKPVISVDVTAPTTGTVTVTAEFSGNSVSRQYSLDGETWIDYTGGITFTENGAVSFRGLNVVGTSSEVATYEVKNIDRTPPEKPLARADVTTPTNADVLVTATFGEDAVVREYSLDGENWCPYPGGIMFTSNRKAYFRSFDAAGNVSEVAEYQVTNIDRTAPDKPVISVDVTEPTGQPVTVSAAFSDDSAVREYSFDGKEWLAYTEAVVCEGNETVSFRGTDAAGNVSQVALYAVQNIDVTAPTDPTGLDLIVSGRKVALVWNASSDESSGVKEYIVTYSLNGQEITARTGNSNYVLTDAELGSYAWSVRAVDFAGNESAGVAGEAFSVSQSQQPGPEPEPEVFSTAKGDIDGNGVSDVLFRWTGGDNQIGFWMNGRTQWQGQGRTHSPEWTVLGAHDMNSDGKADVVLIGRASIVDMNGTYIGYYSGGVDTDDNWHTVGFLTDQGPSNAAWKNAVGNLTGTPNANSVVWYSSNLYVVGVWTDGTDDWTVISRDFGGADWTMVGCGDFDGDGKDSVVMSGANGAYFYTADLDGTVASMGSANWSGWDACAIGDFAGDGKDDMVLIHKEYGAMVMLADGRIDSYVSLGQLDPNDWFVVGAGDYDGDAKDDLLVRQNSTGMLGYYSSGDMAQWNTLGYGVDMSWTVIA